MDQGELLSLLKRVERGEERAEDAYRALRLCPFEDLGYAKVDHHRALRQGAGEVIYGAGKTQEQILGIAKALLEKDARDILITRLDPEKAAFLEGKLPFIYYPLPRIGGGGSPGKPAGAGLRGGGHRRHQRYAGGGGGSRTAQVLGSPGDPPIRRGGGRPAPAAGPGGYPAEGPGGGGGGRHGRGFGQRHRRGWWIAR